MVAPSMSSTHEAAVSLPAVQAQLAALEQLLEVYEGAVIEQSDRLERALAEAAERAAEAEVARRRAELTTARAQFLADAGKMLSSTLDYEATLQNVARLAVPAVADWCAVDVREENELERVAVAHADAGKIELVQRLCRHYPERADLEHGVAHVMRAGVPELVPEVRFELLRDSARDEVELELLQLLDPRSYLIVPLQGRGETFGALTLALTGSTRRFDESDLELVLELAVRAAVAIEHARVVRERARTQAHLGATATELEAQTEELHSTVEALESTTQDLLEANEALAVANAEAERARAAAEDANAAKSQFLATMSHELRTPLNAIDGYAELIEIGVHGPVTEQQRRALNRLRRSQKRLLSLINDVLNFAKLEAGQVKFDPRPVLVSDLITDLEMVITPQVNAKQQELVVDPVPPQLRVLADADKAEQILLNLAANAVKFTAEGGTIRITATPHSEQVRIVVSDTGVGIPAHRLDSIFEPFVQVDSGLGRDHAGVGLGLAISRDLARAMGGDLVAQSVLGSGSAFTLFLPSPDGATNASVL
jgi:signal transduction histidine kinase